MREPKLNTSPSPGDEVKTTTCYMCACRCGIKVWLTDGKIRCIQGNPAHPVNQGVLCAKGSAGIMQHYSPARLDKPMLRVGERGTGEFREIEWEEALEIAAGWLAPIRARNPDELAFFTGRDQSQALTGWWAQQFGTINYAAHGGFCSVNMAAGGREGRIRRTDVRSATTDSPGDERPGLARAGHGHGHPFPLSAVTQRPMFMYHAWGAQNAPGPPLTFATDMGPR